MNSRFTNPIYRWMVFLVSFILSGGLIYLGARHAIAEHWAASSNPDLWLRAATLEPSNPDNWYRLGRYRELDFEHSDIPLAITYYRRATSIEPIDALYWLDLASAYETAGDPSMAEDAFHRAQQAYPISGEVAWRYGNFLLRQNRIRDGFEQIHHAVSVDPKLSALAVSRCWHSTQDVDQILKFALPNNVEAYWGAIQFFVTVQQPDAAMSVWKRLATESSVLPLSRASRLLDLLIQSGRIENAVTVWRQALATAGVPALSAGNSVIWDGGFEHDLMNVGFAWRYRPIQGVELGWDEDTIHSGRRSLRITFDASEKLYFQQISQYVAVTPNTPYRFEAYVRTRELNTDSGIRFEIHDPTRTTTPPTITPSVVGTQPWSPLEAVISTGPQTHLLEVSLHRYPSEILTGMLEGTIWLDDVSLVPVSDSPEAR